MTDHESAVLKTVTRAWRRFRDSERKAIYSLERKGFVEVYNRMCEVRLVREAKPEKYFPVGIYNGPGSH